MTAAPDWLLLRGLTRERRHWGEFPARLAHALRGAVVAGIDLPGNGTLHREASPMRVEAMMERCRAQLREAGITPPYRWVAMSLGAMVAVAWAVRHPREISAAVLINTSLRPYARLPQRLRPANYGTLLRIAAGAGPQQAERMILRMTSRMFAPDTPHGDALVEQWSRWRREHPVARANALRQLIAAARFRAPPVAPAVPLLLLAGARDALVDPACSRSIASAWNVPLHVHPDAGHDLPLDAPDWVAARIAEWKA